MIDKLKFLFEKLNLFKANHAVDRNRIFSEIEFFLQNSTIFSLDKFLKLSIFKAFFTLSSEIKVFAIVSSKSVVF